MKKLFIGSLLLMSLIALGGCDNPSSSNESNSLAFEATTTLSLMNKLQSQNPSLLKKETPSEEEISEITGYLEQIDLILSNDEYFKLESVISDREEYTYKDIISFTNFSNEKSTYSLYYNAIKEDQDIDDEEIEISKEYQGIAVYEDYTFDFKCEIETEEESDEKEETMSFTLYQNSNSFIRVKQEIEQELDEFSTEYHYSIVDNGNNIYDYYLDFESDYENGEEENEIELKLNDKKFKVNSRIENNQTILTVKYIDSSNNVSYTLEFVKVIETIDDVVRVTYVLIS